MHRILRVVAPFDPKIERTLRGQGKRTLQQEKEEVQQQIEEIAIKLPFEDEMVENEANKRALRNFALPRTQGSQTSIVRPTVNAKNFEIKSSLIQMVQQSQFEFNAVEDPNAT